MTDPVPLFIHEGGAIFTQNSENVRSTKDLDNTFQLVAGFRFEKQRSNDTYQFYSAVSNMLSIRDYSDETKLEFCLFEGCEYAFNLLLTVTQNTRSLKITTSYGGGILLNELMIIDQVTVYYDGIAVTNDLVNPI